MSNSITSPPPEVTRRSLHGVAELVLAGPQYAATGKIRLRVLDGGVVAPWASPTPRLDANGLHIDGATLPLSGTYAELAAAAGLTARVLTDVYADGAGVEPDDRVEADPAALPGMFDAFAIGATALADFAPDDERVLWPEHFDLAISQSEVNYGVSLGDAFLGEPYAYVGPWQPRRGVFWNTPFGAARTLAELGSSTAVADFFRQGCVHAASDPVE